MAPIPTYKRLPDSVQHDAEKRNDLETGLSQYDEAGVTQDRQKSRKRCGYWRRTVLAVIASLAFLHFGMTLLSLASRSVVFNGGMRHVCGGARKLSTHYKLPSGDKIPSVALVPTGVWRAPQNEVGLAVAAALKAGYRHIDGAWIYSNEKEVGEALKHSGVTRRDVWLTSKLWNRFHAPEKVEQTLDETLASLGTDYLDLYLIHWPVAFNEDGSTNLELSDNPYPTWQKLEEMVEKGKIRNIGVSNFNIRRLQNLTANPLKIRPAVNQVELSFWNPQPDLLKWSRENDILVEAYSPLGSAERVKDSLNVPEIKEISEELGITPAQVIISWHVQRGTVVLPKSVHPDRVIENFQVTKLPQASFDKLEKAATSHKPERGNDPSKKWGIDIFN